MEQYNNSQVFRRHIIEGAKYGAISGLVATWAISTAIASLRVRTRLTD